MRNERPRPDYSLLAIAAAGVVAGGLAMALLLGATVEDGPGYRPASPRSQAVGVAASKAARPPVEVDVSKRVLPPVGAAAARAIPVDEPLSAAQAGPIASPDAGAGAPDAQRPPCSDARRDPSRLVADAQIRPVHEQRRMRGVAIERIRRGSFWEELGIAPGDRIVAFGGVPIDGPQARADLMNALSRSPQVRLRLLTREGRDRWISWEAPGRTDAAKARARCR